MAARGDEAMTTTHEIKTTTIGTPLAAERDPRLCSCGCSEPHVIMTRETADGVKLSIWSDGSITCRRLGTYLRGLGMGRSAYAAKVRARAVRLIADDLPLYTSAEVPAAVKVAEKTYAHAYTNDGARRVHTRVIALRAIAGKAAS